MKRYTTKIYSIMFCSILFIVAGCSPTIQQPTTLLPEIVKVMEEARHNFDMLERLQVQEFYAIDYQDAQNGLIEAERYLREGRQDLAYIAALNSLAATQRIFRELYRDRTQETKGDIRTIHLDDPHNPLKEFLPLLNEILDYAEKIESGKKSINFAAVLEDLERTAELGEQARGMTKILTTDLSFDPGNYKISDNQKVRLQKLSEALIAHKQAYMTLYPDQTFVIITKVVGYADQIDFREETNFLQLLPKEVSDAIPQYPIERRKFLNKWLSEFRAKTSSDLIRENVLKTYTDISQAQIDQESVGLGEEIPPEVRAPYPIQDPRRRICKIYAYITMEYSQ